MNTMAANPPPGGPDMEAWAKDVFRDENLLGVLRRAADSFERQGDRLFMEQVGNLAEFLIYIGLAGLQQEHCSLAQQGDFVRAFLERLNRVTSEHHIYLMPVVGIPFKEAITTSPTVDASACTPVPPPKQEDPHDGK